MGTRSKAPLRRIQATKDSVLVHDIRNLGLRLSLLLSNLEEHYDDPDFRNSASDLLRSTVQKLEGIAGAWASRGDSVLIKVPLELNDLLREVLRTCRPRGRSPGPKVSVSLAEVPAVWGDPYYLRDAFQSVVQNAQEAASSWVTLRSALETRGPRTFVAIEVEDDGPGMSAEFIKRRLFRPFQTMKSGGVGLGLYTARRILRHHRGDVEVESCDGTGTRVRLLLPLPAARRRRA
jgi:signal transduction histidine kinase